MRGPLSPTQDLYRVLQVEPSADLDAIHAAYRRLARLYHPDLNPSPEAAERMRALNAAYRVLSDPGQRATYDAGRLLRPAPATARVVVRPSPSYAPRPRQVVVPPAQPPTALQRRVDRIVAVVGVLLLILIGIYAAVVIPRAEQQFQAELRGERRPATPAPTLASMPPHATSPTVPDRLRSDAGLRSWPGTVLVAPNGLLPFKDLPILRVDATGQGIARYAVYYGDLTTGVATITGLISRSSFDAAAPKLAGCAPSASYCVGLGPGQAVSDAPGLELFRPAHLVGDNPAFVTHRVCCNGVFWSLNWYEASSNMSYTIDLSRNVAALYGTASADADVNAAKAVGALAAQLVRLP